MERKIKQYELDRMEAVKVAPRLEVRLTPETVAAMVWRACHEKRVHWRVGWQLRLLSLLAWALPFAKRPLVKALAFPR